MKKTIIPLFIMASVVQLNAQTEATSPENDSLAVRKVQLSDSTAFGAPDGKKVSREIGAGGGTIASDDGRVELIFPADALTENTTISIQPTTNLAPNGVGKSYWFEPSGIQFKKPVRINFKYTDEESEICPPDWMSLGIQDHQGKWSFADYEDYDSITKTLKGMITHFSGATNVNDIMLKPDFDMVPVNGGTLIMLLMVDTTSVWESALFNLSDPVLWYVNGVLHGNTSVGTAGALAGSIGQYKILVGKYKAPSIMPKKNPVKISVEIYRKTRKGKKLKKRVSTYITVYDEFKISVIHIADNTNTRPKLGTTKWVDSSSVDIRLGPKTEISNIKNTVYQLVEEHFTPTCSYTYVNKDFCAGIIHISGVKGVGIFYGPGSVFPTVTIDFEKRQHMELPRVHVTCRGNRLLQPSFTMTSAIFALPWTVKFEMNGEEQKFKIEEVLPESWGKVESWGTIEIVIRPKHPQPRI